MGIHLGKKKRKDLVLLLQGQGLVGQPHGAKGEKRGGDREILIQRCHACALNDESVNVFGENARGDGV